MLMLARGERLGPYEILVSIGASGMGDRAHIPINAVLGFRARRQVCGNHRHASDRFRVRHLRAIRFLHKHNLGVHCVGGQRGRADSIQVTLPWIGELS